MSHIFSLVSLLFVSGVAAQNGWGVNYNSNSMCALKGSTVTLGCTYSYPGGHSVQKAFWTKQWPVNGLEPPDLLDDPDYKGRVQYLRDKHSDCSLILRAVRKTDQSTYYFRFLTDQRGGKYQGKDGIDLSVADLHVEVPERVLEGSYVTLTCKTTCSLKLTPTFTWYKDGHSLLPSTEKLHLQLVSRENVGRYRCAVLGLNLHSPEVTLNVIHGPKSVSVSINPSGEIVEGSSVTLTCSSDANPPVKYYWFKGILLVATEETYTINSVSSVDSGEYKCKCSNGYIERYSAATVNVLYPPKSVSLFFSPFGYIVEGSSVTLHCSSSDANPPVQNYTWYKKPDKKALHKSTSWIYKISNISSADSGQYQCMVTNKQGSRYSEYKTLTVLYAPNKVLVTISETAENSSVTLTCSSDGNPPVQSYTWFKEGGDSPVGSGHSYSAVQSGSYYCVAQNEYGSQAAAAVTVTVKEVWNAVLYTVLGVVAGCGCLFPVIAVLCIRRKREIDSSNNVEQIQENLYSNVGVVAATNDTTPDPDPANQDDCYYASVVSSGLKHHQHHRERVVDKSKGDNVQYASVRYTHTSADNRCTISMLEDSSVIYSSVN